MPWLDGVEWSWVWDLDRRIESSGITILAASCAMTLVALACDSNGPSSLAKPIPGASGLGSTTGLENKAAFWGQLDGTSLPVMKRAAILSLLTFLKTLIKHSIQG